MEMKIFVSWALGLAFALMPAVASATSADTARADALKQAIRARCWVASRGLFADNPDGDLFSRHMNALAVLYDVVPRDQGAAILARIVAPGKGIDAPEGITPVSYYFVWYLAQAYVHAGRADNYIDLLQTWRDLLKLNYTTWPEERDTDKRSTRSDSHAWSVHPTADLLGIVAGIGPGAPAYGRVRVEPALGGLKQIDATAATLAGPVTVRHRIAGGRLSARITRPAALLGEFVWRGQSYPLPRPTTVLTLDARP
jgi:alpha-L-rhamnosidase